MLVIDSYRCMFRSQTGAPAPPPPPPVGTGLTPDSPVWLRTTGSLVGQATVKFLKPSYLGDGSAVAGDPVTHTRLYAFASEAQARLGSEGSYTATTDCGTSSTGTLTLSAGTYWICAECENAGGASYPSHPIQVVVT
jgi:hypothetical protein